MLINSLASLTVRPDYFTSYDNFKVIQFKSREHFLFQAANTIQWWIYRGKLENSVVVFIPSSKTHERIIQKQFLGTSGHKRGNNVDKLQHFSSIYYSMTLNIWKHWKYDPRLATVDCTRVHAALQIFIKLFSVLYESSRMECKNLYESNSHGMNTIIATIIFFEIFIKYILSLLSA